MDKELFCSTEIHLHMLAVQNSQGVCSQVLAEVVSSCGWAMPSVTGISMDVQSAPTFTIAGNTGYVLKLTPEQL